MKRTIHILQIGCLSAFAFWLVAGAAQAQFNNPYYIAAKNQMAQQNWMSQALINQQTAQAYTSQYGPYPGFGYSGYGVSPFYGTPYGGAGVAAAGAVDPYGAGLANPYSPGGAGYGIGNPYNPYNPYGGGGGGYGGYGYGAGIYGPGFGTGQVLQGSADVMRSYGQVINAQESARLLREQALQAKLETRKKAFELEMYIKANTPTYTQEQERIVKSTLRRIQTNSLPGEVTNGKSLNFLVDDLRKFPGKKISLEPITLSEGVLSHLNVTKNTYGLGILRDDGRVNWPVALQERMSVMQRKDMDEKLKELVKGAYRSKMDVNVLNAVRAEVDKMRDDLVKRFNDVPTAQYIDAKRFLQEFHESTVAIEKGEAPIQANFQRFIEGGKSVQDVADYMVQNGLRFGPATANDEPAYRSAHSALASYDIAMNSAFGSETKDQ